MNIFSDFIAKEHLSLWLQKKITLWKIIVDIKNMTDYTQAETYDKLK